MDNLLEKLLRWSNEAPNEIMQATRNNNYKNNKSNADIGWKSITTRECVEKVEGIANFLSSIGLVKGDVGAIYSYNCPEWVQMDLALMLVGACSAGIYVNSSLRTVEYIIQHSEAKILVLDNYKSFQKLFGKKSLQEISSSLKTILFLESQNNDESWPDGAISFSEALEIGKSLTAFKTFKERLSEIKLHDRAMIIYTSGTTGISKGVCLTHENIAFVSKCYSESWKAPPKGRLFSFLPLAHIAERITNLGIGIGNRYAVYFCSDSMSIAKELKEVEPTIALAVPRLWDKLREGVQKRTMHLSHENKNQIKWAMEIGKRYWDLKINLKPRPFLLELKYFIASQLVLKKIRQQLGLGKALRVVSGAAALSRESLEWYRGIGVIIIEAYALTESSGVLSCGTVDFETLGTVGIPYEGVEVRLAADGEIETRGPHVFEEYYKDPLATKEMKNKDWLLTGDIGSIDERGCIKIIGRKREIIKTTDGKMVSPLFLESQLESHSWVDQAVVIGSEKPYLTALITLTEEGSAAHLRSTNLRSKIQEHIDQINLKVASHERIKEFRILTHHFSVDRDESTATFKIKRNVIIANYNEEITLMYSKNAFN